MIVFDAEPLIAYYADEPGSDAVEEWLNEVQEGRRTGVINSVTGVEIHYLVRRENEAKADEYLRRLRSWFRVVDADTVWYRASYFKAEYGVPLGDAFVLATAEHVDGTALVGADDDFGGTNVEISRFRSDPV